MILNVSQLRSCVHEQKLKLGRDVIEALEERMLRILNEGMARARGNQRKTLLGRDV